MEFKTDDGKTLPYRLLLPDGFYKSKKKFPLIVFLHGAGERGNDNEKQLMHGSTLFIDKGNRKKYPAVVIFPQCAENDYWSSVAIDRSKAPLALDFDYGRPATGPMMATMGLVKKLLSEGRVDPKRVYILGLSMGGMGTFEAVYRYPELFAAALPVCGGGDVAKYDQRVAGIPFWIFHGEVDAVVDVRYSRQMVEKLKQLGANVTYSEYPGVNHNSWDNAFKEPDFLKWMFSKKKK
ncbi:MAG: prolyl oligopeptidase family serine peptidase [Cyclobacteriaceae bacterium]|nr:prolyl oligopeptidase family serine peptidase [Cyclobacteriaceae bacterium]